MAGLHIFSEGHKTNRRKGSSDHGKVATQESKRFKIIHGGHEPDEQIYP